MTYVVLEVLALGLVVGFFVLTGHEARRGVRILEPQRTRLDNLVGRANFIVENVNLGEFARDELLHLLGRVGHSIVHICLLVVRSAERLLTRLMRHIRVQPVIDQAPRETAREFVKTLSEFKETINATHPEIADQDDTIVLGSKDKGVGNIG